MRPTINRTGRGKRLFTTPKEESTLWKDAMSHLYGPEWVQALENVLAGDAPPPAAKLPSWGAAGGVELGAGAPVGVSKGEQGAREVQAAPVHVAPLLQEDTSAWGSPTRVRGPRESR